MAETEFATQPGYAVEHTRRTNGIRTIAKSLIQQLSEQGYEKRHVIQLATELIGLLCKAIPSRNTNNDHNMG